MPTKDLLHAITVKQVIAPISGGANNTAQVGAIIDSQGFESVTYIISTGVISDADATFTVLLEDGDNSSLTDNAAVDDAYLISQGTGAPETNAGFQYDDDGEVRTIGYRGPKRYTRLTITPANNTGAWLHGAVCVLGHRRVLPLTQPAT